MSGLRFAAFLAMALVCLPASAVEIAYGVEVGAGSTDNIARTPDNEQSETIALVGVDTRLNREGPRLDTVFVADLTYLDYRENTFDNEVVGTLFADLRARLVPEKLAWVLTESFGQLSLDPFAVTTAANREYVNYLTTGPDVTTRIGSNGSLTVMGRYAMSKYEESNLDDARAVLGMSVARELSADRILSLNVTSERVEFDDTTVGSNYDRQSVFVRYSLDGARTRVSADAGYTQIHDLGDTSSNPLIEVEITREAGPRSYLTLRAGIRSADSASALAALNTLGVCSPTNSGQTASPDPYESQFATVCWQYDAQRTSFFVSASLDRDKYARSTQLDRDREIFQASIERQLSPKVSVGIQGWLYRADYEAAGQVDEEAEVGIYFSWNISGRLFLELDGEMFERDSTNALTSFDEKRAFLRFAWRERGESSTIR